jgi:trehalose 6-phosphate phosphatase
METSMLRPLARDPGNAGLFLDFDGTLSEIVSVPSEARPVPGAKDLLSRLSEALAVVAIVSGRSARELVRWFGPEVEIWGVHGAERAADGEVTLSARAEPYAGLMAAVREEAAARLDELGLQGVLLEDKGVMVGLHFRAAEDVAAARRALDRLADELATRHGLRRGGGRLAFELRPPIELSKATVVLDRSREAGLEAAAFIGDDRVDLPGFDALDSLAEEGVRALRVAVDSSEVPPELLQRADIVVEGPQGVIDFLERLWGQLSGPR